jgi:hypothetical protein
VSKSGWLRPKPINPPDFFHLGMKMKEKFIALINKYKIVILPAISYPHLRRSIGTRKIKFLSAASLKNH